jgi:hypothetical protein
MEPVATAQVAVNMGNQMRTMTTSDKRAQPLLRNCSMTSAWIALLLWLTTIGLRADEWTASDEFLDVIRKIESADGQFTLGDHGNSRGDFQISAGAWLDVSAWRRVHNLITFDYETWVWDPAVSRSYAADYCRILRDHLAQKMKRQPTLGEVYAAYNMGFTAFARCQFRLEKVNTVTATKCRYIDSLLAANRPPGVFDQALSLAGNP